MEKIIFAGCGALGSKIATQIITSPEQQIILIDYDKVEENNVITGTSAFNFTHIGQLKPNALASILWYQYKIATTAVNKKIENQKDLTRLFSEFWKDTLIIDTMDNFLARARTGFASTQLPNVIHVAVSPQLIGVVEWDNTFDIPDVNDEDQENEVCTHLVGRDIINLTATIASITINEFLLNKKKRNSIVTLPPRII